MIRLKLLALAFVMTGPCVYVSTRRGCRPERAIAPVLCAQSLMLILLGYFLPFSAAIGLVGALSAAAWAAALADTGCAWKKQLQFLLRPVLLYAVIEFLYEACAGRVYLSFDEFSHWGILPKVIALFDALPRAGLGAAYIQYTYPPAGAMLPAASMMMMGVREGAAYVGYAMLLFGLIAGLAARMNEKGGIKSLFIAVFIYLVMVAVFPLSILRLFIEPLIALLTAHLIIGVLDERSCTWEDVLYAAMLAMTKNTGPIFVLLALLIRLIVRPNRREAAAAVRTLLVALAVYASYQVYCHVQGIEAIISPSHLEENIRALLSGTLHEAYASLPARYLKFFFTVQLPDSGVYSNYGFGTCASVNGLMLLLSAAHIAICDNRRQALRLWGGIWLANLLYTVMIVASYFISFELAEVAQMAEADRYSMLMPLITGILACALIMRESSRALRPAAVVCAAFAALLWLSHPEMTVKTFITREYIEHTIWAQDETNNTADFIKSHIPAWERARVLCMGEYNYEQLHCMLAGVCDIGRFDESWANAPWAGDAQALRQTLAAGDYTYVFVGGEGSGDRVIDERYAALTYHGEVLVNNSLYSVGRDAQGGVWLAPLAAMDGSEI